MTFTSKNPATEEIIWEGKAATKDEVDRAVQASRKALSAWSDKPIGERIKILHAFHDTLAHNRDKFAETVSKETGKPLWEAQTEVNAMLGKIEISIHAHNQRCSPLQHGLAITRHKPHGVIAVLGPFNFPGHLPNGHIVPALLAGNTIVFKPSEQTPLTSELTVQIWKEAGLPKNTLNLVQGGYETGNHLASHPDINGLFFTGSWNTGQALAKQFATQPEKILALEMGGNNPLIVSETSDPIAAAYLTIQSAFITAGQRCTCARRLILHTENKNFLDTLTSIMQKITIGPYTDTPEPFIGPVINAKATQSLLKAQQDLIDNGAISLIPMQNTTTNFLTPGLLDVTNVSNRPDQEYFGPLLQLIRVSNFNEAIKEANNTAYGLSAGLFSDNKAEYELFYREIRAGIVNWNTPTTGASSNAPFGGIGHSGNHRPSAFYAADYCSYPVASMEVDEIAIPKHITPGFVGALPPHLHQRI